MGLDVRKSVFNVSDQERLKQVCSATETRNFACSKSSYFSFQKASNNVRFSHVKAKMFV